MSNEKFIPSDVDEEFDLPFDPDMLTEAQLAHERKPEVIAKRLSDLEEHRRFRRESYEEELLNRGLSIDEIQKEMRRHFPELKEQENTPSEIEIAKKTGRIEMLLYLFSQGIVNLNIVMSLIRQEFDIKTDASDAEVEKKIQEINR
jgi:hypothetical protein